MNHMRYIYNNNQFLQKIRYLNQISLPDLSIPLQIDFLYINCIPQNGLTDTIHHFFHEHTYFEFHFPTNCAVRYSFGTESVNVRSDQFIVIQPNVEHTLEEIDPDLIKFGFGVTFSSPNPNAYTVALKNALSRHEYSVGAQNEKMQQCFDRILSECESPSFFTPYAIRDLIAQILLEIAMILDKNFMAIYKDTDSANDHRVAMAKKFINDNMNKPLDTATVANYLHISIKQLNRIFQKSEGVSVSKFISSAKQSEAIKMLSTTDLFIKEIAFQLGFDNEKSFGSFFKKLCQLSPSDFRKSYRKYANPDEQQSDEQQPDEQQPDEQ